VKVIRPLAERSATKPTAKHLQSNWQQGGVPASSLGNALTLASHNFLATPPELLGKAQKPFAVFGCKGLGVHEVFYLLHALHDLQEAYRGSSEAQRLVFARARTPTNP